tara:strand:+ start:994 stop:1290 length:297 start_codon:yes stop_codon:yes gene_type:complete
MRINLTKKDVINSIYMQIGYSKNILDVILDDILNLIIDNLKKKKKVKISNFGSFEVRHKKQREGRNPKTKETKLISERYVVLFKPSKEFKNYINNSSV